ncbi:MAG: hypothetical protein PHD53_00175 [Methylococcales bacterium]|nr:hypothetical protein [Methylococcales bacterium]
MDKVFYGIRYDAATGRLTADRIDDNSPREKAKYADSFTSTKYMTFHFNGAHLQASIL